MCSTPFGIIGIPTVTPSTIVPSIPLCSTPFGIIGIPTHYCCDSHAASHVLNAFRHHWNSHAAMSTLYEETCGAQRLSASLEFSPFLVNNFGATFLCSTPFGIIGIPTRLARGASRSDAKRAQRLSASLEFPP